MLEVGAASVSRSKVVLKLNGHSVSFNRGVACDSSNFATLLKRRTGLSDEVILVLLPEELDIKNLLRDFDPRFTKRGIRRLEKEAVALLRTALLRTGTA